MENFTKWVSLLRKSQFTRSHLCKIHSKHRPVTLHRPQCIDMDIIANSSSSLIFNFLIKTHESQLAACKSSFFAGDSSSIVTGPSFTMSTCMYAPNLPSVIKKIWGNESQEIIPIFVMDNGKHGKALVCKVTFHKIWIILTP